MVLVLDVDDAPAVLAAAHGSPADDDGVLAADDGEGDHAVDAGVGGAFLLVLLVVVVGVHAEVVEGEFLLDALFEGHALFQGEGVGLGDYGDDVNHVGELLQHDDVDGLEGVAGRLDEEEAAVNAGILDVALPLCGEFFPKVAGVLVLDVLDNWIPTRAS